MKGDDIPSVMSAMVLLGNGDYDQYQYREGAPVPTPGHGEVLIEVEAASINNTDVATRTDWYAGKTGKPRHFPRIQGADAVGRIVATGANVSPDRIGERVLCDPRLRAAGQLVSRFPGHPALLLGADADGAFAQYVVVPEVNAWKVSEEPAATELASYPVAYSTALDMLMRARTRPGQTMVVTGASGGVGTALVQLGKLFALDVIAVASPSKAARLRELGADAVVDRSAPDLGEALRAAGVDEFDVVADVVGGSQLAQLIGLVRARGRCVTAGGISDPIAPVDLRHLIYHEIELIGVAASPEPVFAALMDLINSGRVRAPVAATYPLRELVAAQQQFVAKQHVGKIALEVGGQIGQPSRTV